MTLLYLMPGMNVATIKTDVRGNIDMIDVKRNADKVYHNIDYSCIIAIDHN